MSGRIKKVLNRGSELLFKSEKRLEDIYNIVFSNEGVFSRTYKNGRVEEISYREAKNRIERLADTLAERVGEGNFVGLYGYNCAEWLLLFWAVLKSGNKPYLINLRQPESHISSVLSTLKVKFILCTDATPSFAPENITYAELAGRNASVSHRPFADEIAITTSGTTLQEKICLYTGREISAQILNSREAVERNSRIIKGSGGEIRMLMLLPLYHIFGLVASYLWFLFTGAVFIFSGERGTLPLLETARRLKVTHVFSVPLLWHNVEKKALEEIEGRAAPLRGYIKACLNISLFLQNLFPKAGLLFPKLFLYPLRKRLLGGSIRFLISGGSRLKSSAMKFSCALGYPLFSGYGSTEIGIAAVDFSKRPKDRAFPCAGKNFSSVEFEIRANGRLYVKGDSVCKKQIVDGVGLILEDWFDTGDVAFCDHKGKYHIAGRQSDLVISDNGENLNPDLAEQAFNLSLAKEFTVLGDERNERLILIVRVEEDLSPEETETLKEEISLGQAALPSSYRIHRVFLTKAPLLADGEIKISRTRLRNLIKDRKTELFTFDIIR